MHASVKPTYITVKGLALVVSLLCWWEPGFFLGRGLGRILASLFQSERAQEMLLWVAENRALLHMWVLSLHD